MTVIQTHLQISSEQSIAGSQFEQLESYTIHNYEELVDFSQAATDYIALHADEADRDDDTFDKLIAVQGLKEILVDNIMQLHDEAPSVEFPLTYLIQDIELIADIEEAAKLRDEAIFSAGRLSVQSSVTVEQPKLDDMFAWLSDPAATHEAATITRKIVTPPTFKLYK